MENLRLRCRAHNQLEAERAYGAEFMHAKREAGRAEAADRARAAAEATRAAIAAREAGEQAQSEVIRWLRQLGVRLEEAKRAVAASGAAATAPLEERVREALRHLAPPGTRRYAAAGAIAP